MKTADFPPLKIATVGCGSRARTYTTIAMSLDGRYTVTAGADPVLQRREAMRSISKNPDFRAFETADDLLAEEQLADVLIIGTQDQYHFEPARKALEKGYDLLLEKPAAQTLEETLELARLAKKYKRKILLCFVLRYTDFYSKAYEIVQSGRLGEVINIHATEAVDAWHHSHSYVRGHWSRTDKSTPMIIAKCSHDTDYIAWLMGSRCASVSSYGKLSYFIEAKAPEGATDRCTSGCPHALPQGGNCTYDCHHYLDKNKTWTRMIYPHPTDHAPEKVLAWLKTSPWSRCAWKCDNDVPDHQVVNMRFENGGTASLTMTAFDCGRGLEIYGTKACLRGGDIYDGFSMSDLSVRDHDTGETELIKLKQVDDDGYQGHGGGDYGLVNAMDAIFRGEGSENSLIEQAVEGHVIGFAAEESRLSDGVPIELDAQYRGRI